VTKSCEHYNKEVNYPPIYKLVSISSVSNMSYISNGKVNVEHFISEMIHKLNVL